MRQMVPLIQERIRLLSDVRPRPTSSFRKTAPTIALLIPQKGDARMARGIGGGSRNA